MTYTPQKRSQLILDRAKAHIDSVPYQVSLRWLFYRLYQDGVYTDKKDYKKAVSLFSKVRKEFYEGWTPETLIDDTRGISTWGQGFYDEEDFLRGVGDTACHLDQLEMQNALLVVLFEAKAMSAQFDYYLPYAAISLPFGGDVSIYAKWRLAGLIAERWSEYRLPVHILYFGDYDAKGLEIEKAAKADILKWTYKLVSHNNGNERDHAGLWRFMESVSWKRGGLSEEQVEAYQLPLSIEGAGYQWEALTDRQAKEIIDDAVDDLIDEEAIEEVKARENVITERFQKRFKEVF